MMCLGNLELCRGRCKKKLDRAAKQAPGICFKGLLDVASSSETATGRFPDRAQGRADSHS